MGNVLKGAIRWFVGNNSPRYMISPFEITVPRRRKHKMKHKKKHREDKDRKHKEGEVTILLRYNGPMTNHIHILI